MIDGLCQAYHWTVQDCMRLTMPQIIMLNHGAWVNQETHKRRYEKDKSNPDTPLNEAGDDPWCNGKRMSDMTSEEMAKYVMKWE